MYRNVFKNFKISNKIFAKYLKDKKLVLEKDKIVEIFSPVNLAAGLNFEKNETVICSNNNSIIKRIAKEENDFNFIYNGLLCDDIEDIIYNTIQNERRFNTGICTKNFEEYNKYKKDYELLKEKLNNDNIDVYEEDINKHKVYLLSYHKKD